jgi:hypothetical protein
MNINEWKMNAAVQSTKHVHKDCGSTNENRNMFLWQYHKCLLHSMVKTATLLSR